MIGFIVIVFIMFNNLRFSSLFSWLFVFIFVIGIRDGLVIRGFFVIVISDWSVIRNSIIAIIIIIIFFMMSEQMDSF